MSRRTAAVPHPIQLFPVRGSSLADDARPREDASDPPAPDGAGAQRFQGNEIDMKNLSTGGRRLLVGMAIFAAAAFGTPKIVAHAAGPAIAPAVTVTILDMGGPLTARHLAAQ